MDNEDQDKDSKASTRERKWKEAALWFVLTFFLSWSVSFFDKYFEVIGQELTYEGCNRPILKRMSPCQKCFPKHKIDDTTNAIENE